MSLRPKSASVDNNISSIHSAKEAAIPTTSANDILQTLREWDWICDSVLIQPWARRRTVDEDTTTHECSHWNWYMSCLQCEEDLLYLHNKWCGDFRSSISSREELVQFHLRQKSLLVPLNDVGTAVILRSLFETWFGHDDDCVENEDGDKSSTAIMRFQQITSQFQEQAHVIQRWIQCNILLIHNLDGNQTQSRCKEVDSFPSSIPKSKIKSNLNKFTFVDLFAGIGGFRSAMESLGGTCLGCCEIDPYARSTYKTNFDTRNEFYVTDIARLDIDKGEVDVLCAGFPCQSFSTLADSSNNRKVGECSRGGLETPKKGRLFFQLLRILRKSQPKIFVFENVKGLVNLEGGHHLDRILQLLEESGYCVTHGIVDTAWFLPQRRERVFFVGVRRDLLDLPEDSYVAFVPQEIQRKYQIYDNEIRGDTDRFDKILLKEKDSDNHANKCEFSRSSKLHPSRMGDILESVQCLSDNENSHTFLSPHQWKKISAQSYTQVHSDGSGQLLTEDDACAQTLVSSYRQSYLMHSQFIVPRDSLYLKRQNDILLREAQERKGYSCNHDYRNSDAKSNTILDNKVLPRFFTPRECCRLQGFPETFIIPTNISNCNNNQKQQRQCISHFYRQIGNSVSPPCVIAVAENSINRFLRVDQSNGNEKIVSSPVFDAVVKASPCPGKVMDLIQRKVYKS